MGRGAPVRRLSGAAAGARGSIPMPSEPPLAAETGHERRADMPNQHLGWNSVTRRPLAPPRPDWPVRRGLPSNPSATATRGRRPSSPRPTLRRISTGVEQLKYACMSNHEAPAATICAEIMQAYFSCCKVTMDYQHWYLGPNTQGEGRDLRSRPIGGPGGRGRRIAACFESVIVIRCTCSGRLRPRRPLSR